MHESHPKQWVIVKVVMINEVLNMNERGGGKWKGCEDYEDKKDK